jgi:Flp pilus assembly protein TadD
MQKQINSAIAFYSSGHIHKALDVVKSLISDYPKEAILHNISGACYAALGQTEDAIDSFTEAVIIKPDYAEAHNSLGVSLQSSNQLKKLLKASRMQFPLFQIMQKHITTWGIPLKS